MKNLKYVESHEKEVLHEREIFAAEETNKTIHLRICVTKRWFY